MENEILNTEFKPNETVNNIEARLIDNKLSETLEEPQDKQLQTNTSSEIRPMGAYLEQTRPTINAVPPINQASSQNIPPISQQNIPGPQAMPPQNQMSMQYKQQRPPQFYQDLRVPYTKKSFTIYDLFGILGFVASIVGMFIASVLLHPLGAITSILSFNRGQRFKGLAIAGVVIAIIGLIVHIVSSLYNIGLIPSWISEGAFH